MKIFTLLLTLLILTACFSEESKDYSQLKGKLAAVCTEELKNPNLMSDSTLMNLILLKSELDSLSISVSLEELRTQMSRVPKCLELFQYRKNHPRPKPKKEYYNLDSL